MAVVKADGYGHGMVAGGPRRARRRRHLARRLHDRRRRSGCAPPASRARSWPGCGRPARRSPSAIAADVDLSVASLDQLDELVDAASGAVRPAVAGPPQDRHRPEPQRRDRRRLAGAGRGGREGAGRRRHRRRRRLEPLRLRRRARRTRRTDRQLRRRSTTAWTTAAARRPDPAVPPHRQLGRHADPPRHALRPRPAGHRDLRPVADPGARRRVRAAAGDDAPGPGSCSPSGCRPARASPTGTRTRRPRRRRSPGAARVRRRRAAARVQRRPGRARRPGAHRSPAGSAWTRSCSTAATIAVAAGDVATLFGPGDDGEPTADDWAAAIGTINYEIVTRIGSARVDRTYDELPDDSGAV